MDDEEDFFKSVSDGKVEMVREILGNNPSLDVNWENEEWDSYTPLHEACTRGHDAIVSILLAHPDIKVNLKDNAGNTPFLSACFAGSSPCVSLLLKDLRVAANEPDDAGYTPLFWAACSGHLEVIKVVDCVRKRDGSRDTRGCRQD